MSTPIPRKHSTDSMRAADQTRALLRQREAEIDKRVNDLQNRLGGASAAATPKRGSGDRVHRGSSAHGGLTPVNPPAIKRSISASSDDSHYGIKSGPSGRSKRSIGATFGNDSDGQGSSAYPTQRRITAMKKPAFVPTPPPAKKAKKGWSSWFCPCYPGRRGAERDATSANARFERQRLLAEEGRLPGYGSGPDIGTPSNDYHAHYAYGSSHGAAPTPRSNRNSAHRSASPRNGGLNRIGGYSSQGESPRGSLSNRRATGSMSARY